MARRRFDPKFGFKGFGFIADSRREKDGGGEIKSRGTPNEKYCKLANEIKFLLVF